MAPSFHKIDWHFSFRSMKKPNYTQVPNEILDRAADFSPAEFKIILIICRQTFGYHRDSKTISIGKICEQSGLSRQGVVNSIDGLVFGGWIRQTMTEEKIYEFEIIFEQDAPPTQLRGGANSVEGGAPTELGVAYSKKEKKKETFKEKEDLLLKESPRERLPEAQKEHWDEWKLHLRQKRIKSTPLSEKMQVNKLLEWTVPEAIAAIRNSIERNYQSIFQPPAQNGYRNGTVRHVPESNSIQEHIDIPILNL